MHVTGASMGAHPEDWAIDFGMLFRGLERGGLGEGGREGT